MAKKSKELKEAKAADDSVLRSGDDGVLRGGDVRHLDEADLAADDSDVDQRCSDEDIQEDSDSCNDSKADSGSNISLDSDDDCLSFKSLLENSGLDNTHKEAALILESDSTRTPGVRSFAPEEAAALKLVGDVGRTPCVRSNALEKNSIIPGSVDAVFNACGGAPNLGVPGKASEAKQQPQLGGHGRDSSGFNAINSSRLKQENGPQVWAKNAPTEFHGSSEPEENYTVDGIINLDDSEAAEIKAEYEHALVGRVASSNFRFEWLSSQIHAKWGAYEGFKVIDLGQGCFLLSFANRENRDAVWLGGPWHIAGKVVGLDRWTAKFIPSRNPQILAPTWVRIPGLPLLFWGEKNLWRIAAAIGEPIYIDAFTKSRSRGSYARICVRRNLAAPLLGGIWLNSQETGKFFQKLPYEGMDPVCTTCGFAGHDAEECNSKLAAKATSIVDPNQKGLDGWTCIQSKKPPKTNQNNLNSHRQPSFDPKKLQIKNAKQGYVYKPPNAQSTNPFNSLNNYDDMPEEFLKPAAKTELAPQIHAKTTFLIGECSSANLPPNKIKKNFCPEKTKMKFSSLQVGEDPAVIEGKTPWTPRNKKKTREDYLADDDEEKKMPPPPRRERNCNTDVEP